MGDVRRFTLVRFTNRGGDPDAKMGIAPDGNWVEYEDYAALERERDKWQEMAGDSAQDSTDQCARANKLEQELDALKAELTKLRDQDRHRGGSGWWMNLPPKDWTE